MTQLAALGDLSLARSGRRVHGAFAVWGPDPAWLRCLLDRSCLPGQPVWRFVSTSLGGAGRRSWTGASTVAGRGGAPIDAPALLAVAAVLLVAAVLAAAWWMRHRGRYPARLGSIGGRPAAPGAGAALELARGQVWREFDAVTRLLSALPADAPVFDGVPLLRDQVGIAAHGSDRLLSTVLQARAGEPVLHDCALLASRLLPAVVQLRAALSAEAGHAVDVGRVAAAMATVEDAVDKLYVVVTAALPPPGGPALGDR